MSRGLPAVLGTMLFFAGCSAFAQDAQLTLPGATGQTAIFDSFDNLMVVTRTVPAGYMQLFKAYDGSNVNLSGKIVSAVYDGMFYIEETVTPPPIGVMVAVTGVSSVWSAPNALSPAIRPRRQADVLMVAES